MPRGRTWGGIDQPAPTPPASKIRRIQTAPSKIDPLVFLTSQLESLEVGTEELLLRQKLGLTQKEWDTLLKTLKGDRLLPRNIVPKHVEPNNSYKTQVATRGAIFELDKDKGPHILHSVIGHLSIQRSSLQHWKFQDQWGGLREAESAVSRKRMLPTLSNLRETSRELQTWAVSCTILPTVLCDRKMGRLQMQAIPVLACF